MLVLDYENFLYTSELPLCDYYGAAKHNKYMFIMCMKATFESIRVFEDTAPFDLLMLIPLDEIGIPCDLKLSAASQCLYVVDLNSSCIWKITLEDDHQVTKWLCSLKRVLGIVVTSDGRVVVLHVDETSSEQSVEIYGSDAVSIRTVDHSSIKAMIVGLIRIFKIDYRSHGNGNHSLTFTTYRLTTIVIISQFNVTGNGYKFPRYELCVSTEFRLSAFNIYFSKCFTSPLNLFYREWKESVFILPMLMIMI